MSPRPGSADGEQRVGRAGACPNAFPGVPRDELRRIYLPPARIMWQEGGPEGEAYLERPDLLLRAGEGQATRWRPAGCTLAHRGRAPGVCLDFGRELSGGVRLVSGGVLSRVVRVRLRFGESVSEAMNAPRNDHAMHDTLLDLPAYSTTFFGNTGFRFVRIDLVDPGSRLELREAGAFVELRDLAYRGWFRCSDPLLNAVWDASVWTVHLCMQQFLWEGVKRDRMIWTPEQSIAADTISVVFGHHDIVPRTYDFLRDETPLPAFMNGYSSMSLWWIVAQRNWYRYHKDRGYLEAQSGYLAGLIELLVGFVDADGHERLPEERFLDWHNAGDEEALRAGTQALLAYALRCAAELCDILGDGAHARLAAATATTLDAAAPVGRQTKASIALRVMGGSLSPNEALPALCERPFEAMSLFTGYHILVARALAGDLEGCLDLLRGYWGRMIELGATTFWEHFDVSWTANAGRIDELPVPHKDDIHADFGRLSYERYRNSFCHAWGGAPATFLAHYVLGVRPLCDGFDEVAVVPGLGDLQWAEGAVATRHGEIRVRHERASDGAIGTKIELPPGVRRRRPTA